MDSGLSRCSPRPHALGLEEGKAEFETSTGDGSYRETLVRSTSGPDGIFTVPSFSPVTNNSKFFRGVTVRNDPCSFPFTLSSPWFSGPTLSLATKRCN